MKNSKIKTLEDFLKERNFVLQRNEVTLEVEQFIRGKKVTFNDNTLYCQLEKNGLNVSANHILSFVQSDLLESYNPFEDYFERVRGLYQEANGDLIDQLAHYITAKDQERFNVSFKKMLVRTVACSLDDQVFNKQIFILVHEKQNSGKTTFLRWLVPPDLRKYYQENIETNKDGLIALSENFVINYDELAGLQKREVNSLKSFISKDFIKVRPPYGRKTIRAPRRASFVGSTNDLNFLTDSTGSVRWLCHEIEHINWDYAKDFKIDEIWSQAYSLYNSGFKYQLSNIEIAENEMANRRFQVVSDEAEILEDFFLPGNDTENHYFLTSSEILGFLKSRNASLQGLSSNYFGKILSSRGFNQESKYDPDSRYSKKGYYVRLRKPEIDKFIF